jgi:hypothetical protein
MSPSLLLARSCEGPGGELNALRAGACAARPGPMLTLCPALVGGLVDVSAMALSVCAASR